MDDDGDHVIVGMLLVPIEGPTLGISELDGFLDGEIVGTKVLVMGQLIAVMILVENDPPINAFSLVDDFTVADIVKNIV